jgi:hypothetical protein
MSDQRIIATVRDQAEMQQALRLRAEAMDVSREVLDELAGLTRGHTGKLLCDPPVKTLGTLSMFLLAGALGLKVVLVEDDQRMAVLAKQPKRSTWGARLAMHWRNVLKQKDRPAA